MIVSVQYLRGIAALLVLLAHISYKDMQYSLGSFHFDIGIFGVDIFFVISGFVMYYISQNIENSFRGIICFFKQRVIRIIPLYWLVSCLALMIYIIAPERVNSSTGSTDILNSFTLFPSETKYLVAVGWTLSYEFYFYFLFSISLFFKYYKALIISVILLSLVFVGEMLFSKTFLQNFLTNSLLLEFFYGILIAKYYLNHFTHRAKFLLGFIIVGLFILYINFFSDISTIRGFYFGFPAMVIVLVLVSCEKYFKKHKSILLTELGNMSYSLYLVHLFVLAFVAIIYKLVKINTFVAEIIYLIAMFSLSILIGYVVYKFIESPLLKYFKTNFTCKEK